MVRCCSATSTSILEKGDKIVFLSHNPRAMTALFEIINELDAGTFNWGCDYHHRLPAAGQYAFFNTDLNLVTG